MTGFLWWHLDPRDSAGLKACFLHGNEAFPRLVMMTQMDKTDSASACTRRSSDVKRGRSHTGSPFILIVPPVTTPGWSASDVGQEPPGRLGRLNPSSDPILSQPHLASLR